MSATYAGGLSGALIPLLLRAQKIIDFRTIGEGYSKRFDKFEFDRQARRLEPGQALRVQDILDTGPGASLEMDPDKLWSYPSDVYAVRHPEDLLSAISGKGLFDE